MNEHLKTLENAQVTVTELSKLLRVSRVTTSKWLHGRCQPSPFHAPRLTKILAVIQEAVDTGKLPGGLDIEKSICHVRRRDRLKYIREQLASVLEAGKEQGTPDGE